METNTAIEKLYRKQPCRNCPFTKTCKKGWLPHRIESDLKSDSFVCHETAQSTMDKRKQCAGHMLLLKEQNSFFRLAKRLEIELNLKGVEVVFESPEMCIEHHKSRV